MLYSGHLTVRLAQLTLSGVPFFPRLDDEASVGRDERRPTCARREFGGD